MTLMLKKTTLYYLGLVVTLLIIANCGGSGYKNITGPEPITVDGVTFERIRVGWNENIDECVVMAFFTRQSDESDDFPPHLKFRAFDAEGAELGTALAGRGLGPFYFGNLRDSSGARLSESDCGRVSRVEVTLAP